MTDTMELKRYRLAREILKDAVGLSWDKETSTITMTPDSFVRCIDRASRHTPPADAKKFQCPDGLECSGDGWDCVDDGLCTPTRKRLDELLRQPDTPAPVTDTQRAEALEAFARITQNLPPYGQFTGGCQSANDIQAVTAALSSPAQAQVDVEAVKHDAMAAMSYECLSGAVCGKDDAFLVGKVGLAMFNHITAHYHLTPKTQSEE